MFSYGRERETRQWCWPDGAEGRHTTQEGKTINYIEGPLSAEFTLDLFLKEMGLFGVL